MSTKDATPEPISEPVSEPTSAARPERPLGARYLLGEVIGRGAMGRVYRGRIRDGEPNLAIKLLRDDLAEDPELVARFVQERQLLRTITHPHVVTVHDLILDGDDLAIVMDYVDGGSLTTAVPRPCPPELAAELSAQLAEALTAVHAAGVVHRDLKPGNVLCQKASDGTIGVRLTDFGVSRLLSGTLTRVTSLIGTPGYLAPEVTRGQPATAATDVYALGVMLYELLTGRAPFLGDNAHALIRAHNDDPAPRPANLPDALWTLLDQMLAKAPDARPTTTRIAAELRRLAPGLTGTGPFPVRTAPLPATDSSPTMPGGVTMPKRPATPPAAQGIWPLPASVAAPPTPARPPSPSPAPAVPAAPAVPDPAEAPTEIARIVRIAPGQATPNPHPNPNLGIGSGIGRGSGLTDPEPPTRSRRLALVASGATAVLAVTGGIIWAVNRTPRTLRTTTVAASAPTGSTTRSATPATATASTAVTTSAGAVPVAPAGGGQTVIVQQPAPVIPVEPAAPTSTKVTAPVVTTKPAAAVPAPKVDPAATPAPATPVLEVNQATVASRMVSDGIAPLRVSSVSTPSGTITSITITYGGSQPVTPSAGVTSYTTTVTGLSNATQYRFTAEVCNSLGKCATSAAVSFVPYGWPDLSGVTAAVSGTTVTMKWPAVRSNGNPNDLTCSFEVASSDASAPAKRTIGIGSGSTVFSGKPGYTYQGVRRCSMDIQPSSVRTEVSPTVKLAGPAS
ncbi:MAG: serine/threonine protein kinase [Kineosporiaceae bacterium]|nr:serine/threonine protein kinase [Kineosporiaceae bacterium]MBK7621882.1 serine/threonine protein kinase [Kineosporiaceae bacterium]